MTQTVEQDILQEIGTGVDINSPKRTLCVGDIHGGFKSFKQVLERCSFNPEEDQLICLGDYVDGWSETAQLIEYLISLQSLCTHKPIFIKGNHDAWCAEWLIWGKCPDIWRIQGGQATIDSYVKTGLLTSDEHRKFFESLSLYHIDKQNRGFVHGGYISKNGLGYEAYQSNYYWDRTLWEIARAVHHNYVGSFLHPVDKEDFDEYFRPNPYRFEKHKEIFIGHTTTGNWIVKPHLPEYKYKEQPKQGRIVIPMNRCNIWNMDTGGGFEGRLTIMDVDTKEFWQSDDMRTLYPDERGR